MKLENISMNGLVEFGQAQNIVFRGKIACRENPQKPGAMRHVYILTQREHSFVSLSKEIIDSICILPCRERYLDLAI